MLTTTCPRTAAALARCATRARFAAAFGRFRQRTIDRRYCGLLAAAGPALSAAAAAQGYTCAGSWYFVAVALVGGVPSSLCWSPFAHV